MHPDGRTLKGRGAASNRSSRFDAEQREAFDDGWGALDEPAPRLVTRLEVDSSRRVLSYNDSPDLPFDRSVNPYRGCEHGCVYCYARPTHAWLGLSPGLDFESRLFHKPDAPEQLAQELAAPRYRARTLCLGANTDPYQPVERRTRLTRTLLEVLTQHQHPVAIITKSSLVERDIDLLADMAARELCQVAVSIGTLDRELARRMEPRASAPERRLRCLHKLSEAGIPTQVLVAPIVPALNDHEMETILTRAREAGAASARYSVLRLPNELRDLFVEWLDAHYPQRAEHVMNQVRELRGGRDYESAFHTRMRGRGPLAELIARRFEIARRRLGFHDEPVLRCDRFTRPQDRQLELL